MSKKEKVFVFFFLLVCFLSGVLLAATSAKAEEVWTEKDTKMELVYLSLHAMDWAQTRNIARNPDKYYEKNVLLGRHPSTDKVDLYFLLTGVGHYLVAENLNARNRTIFQNVTVLLEMSCVQQNLALGINIKF